MNSLEETPVCVEDEITSFQLREPKIRQYIHNQIHGSQSTNIHLVFQSTSQNSKFSYEIFKLVEDYIFRTTKSQATEMESVASLILQEAELPDRGSQHDNSSFSKTVKSELVNYLVVSGLNEGQDFINLSNQHLDIPIENGSEVYNQYQRAKDTRIEPEKTFKIAAVTCGSTHSALGFLLASGCDSATVTRHLADIETYFRLDEATIQESIQRFEKNDWGLSDRCKINSNYQETVWRSKMDFFK